MSTAAAVLSNIEIERSPSHTATIYLKEAKYEFLKNLRLRVYTASVISFPLMFYVLFGLVLNAKESIGSTHVPTYLIATYGTFGVTLSDVRDAIRGYRARREISSTSRISFPARCGSRLISLPANSDFSVITDSVCPSTSCRSRAILSRSATLARCSISSFALRNLRFIRLRSAKKVLPAPMNMGKRAE